MSLPLGFVHPAVREWQEADHEDYLTFGEPAPVWDVFEEEWEARERLERHHDFVYRAPVRESDDWLMAA